MKYAEFKERIVAGITERLPEASVRLDWVTKRNRSGEVLLVGWKTEEESHMDLCIWLNDIYVPDAGFAYINEIVGDIVQKLKESLLRGCNNWGNILTSADTVKKLVLPVMVNAEQNSEFLKTHPHKTFLDLAVVYYVFVGNESSCITDNIMMSLGLNADELHDIAVGNISKSIFSFGPMKIVSNEKGYFGSGSILKKNLAKEICDNLECDTFYLFPSSVHEWVVLPTDEIELEYAKEMVRDINHKSGCVSEAEWLSDNVYLFDGSEYRIA